MIVFKSIVSILLIGLVTLLGFNFVDEERVMTAMESFVIMCVIIVLFLAVVCIWI